MASSSSTRLVFMIALVFATIQTYSADESRPIVDDAESSHEHEAIDIKDIDDYSSKDDGPMVVPLSHFHDVYPVVKDTQNPKKKSFKMAYLKLEYVGTPFLIALWILIGGLTKIGFHVTPKISLICPESCLLIVVGVIIGLLLFYAGLTNVGPLTPNVFFLYMLPPIVLDAGYYMPNRPFFDNLVTILLYAVVGTVFNAMSVGLSLWAVGLTGIYGVDMPLLDTLLFSSIACAVDPIAVLAVFEEIHVNDVLYILVFGESLLNDAVTVVLYHMFEGYAEMGPKNILPVDYAAGVASFFVVAAGGTVVGILWGLLAAFVSRFTHHVRVIEPLFVFVMSYLAYVSAELFHFSGILALTFCGITMKNYVEENISYKSHVTVKYAMKMLASSSETIIFLFLGVSTVNDNHEWNTWFVIATVFFCTLYRVIGVVILTAIANRFRLHRIDKVEQFILAYGGLRGAVAFALVLIVSERVIPTKNMMITTIIALVFFTVFLQGMTIGPLVRILNVPIKNKIKLSMNERILTRSMDHLMAGIEDIVGQTMGNYHLRDKFKYYNNKYLRPILTREHANAEPKIFETYSKLNVADAMNLVKRNSTLAPGAANLGTSLSSIFRNYTQGQLDKSPVAEKIENSMHSNGSSLLNVDIAELEYSPSNKDLADAELHHILSDAFKPPRRRYISRNSLHGRSASATTNPHQKRTRLQMRHLMDERIPHRRLSSRGLHPGPLGGPDGAQPTASDLSERSVGSNSSDGGLISGRRKNGHPPPKLRFSVAGDDDTDTPPYEATPLPRQEGGEPLSSYSSLYDVSASSHDDDGIIFTAAHRRTPTPLPPYTKEETSESDGDTSSLQSIPTQTITELTLPWKRDVETGEGSSDCSNYVMRQQEFPSWVENRDYLIHGSPTNTMLSRLGSVTQRVSPPAVFEIFDESESKKPSSPPSRRRNSQDFRHEPEPEPRSDPDHSTRINLEPKDVIIEIKVNGISHTATMVSAEEENGDDVESQATRL